MIDEKKYFAEFVSNKEKGSFEIIIWEKSKYGKAMVKEAYYAFFHFIQPLFAATTIFIISTYQAVAFNFYAVFCLTIPMAIISVVFILHE